MRGLITTRHLIINAPLIVQEFGLIAYVRCFVRALWRRQQATFLNCIVELKQGSDAQKISSTSPTANRSL